MRRLILPIVFGTSILASAMTAFADNDHSDTKDHSDIKTIAVFGDAPYGASPSDTVEFSKTPAFIDSINADHHVSLVMHAGDIHSGKQYCTEDYDQSIYDLWTAFRDPLVYTPGDNEWTDCHKPKEGGNVFVNGVPVDYANGDPVANLDLVRSIFFASPGHTLGAEMKVHSQAREFDDAHQSDANYVENVWWDVESGPSRVLFVTLNMPGGSNNDSDIWYGGAITSPAQAQEIQERSGADLRWLDKAFKHARSGNTKAVVIMLQADMWDLDSKQLSDNHLTQYKQFIDSIASHTREFGKPVLLINGDSHFYRSDNPLVQGAPCAVETTVGTATTTCADSVANGVLKGITIADPYDTQPNGYHVANFHRIVVHGNATPSSTPMEWIKLTIDPHGNAPASENAFGPFSWQRVQPALP